MQNEKSCDIITTSVGAGIPVGVYVFVAHRQQEMLNVSSANLPTFFYVLSEGLVILLIYFSTKI